MMKDQALKNADGPDKSSAPVPLPAHERIYREIRRLVLFGDLTPGQPVTIQGLTEMLDAGMTPVREAIRRLTAEGALEFQGNRRVCVPKLTARNIEELILVRQSIEPELVHRAAQRVRTADLDRLAAIDSRLDRAISSGDVHAYLQLNYQFHTEIYALADAPILQAVADGLWLRFGPSLRVVCGRLGTQNLPDQHKEALDAMRAGNAKEAANAMRKDVIQGMEQVRRALPD